MNPDTHRRFLEYRDLFVYFGRMKTQLSYKEFEPLDIEWNALRAKDRARDDEEEARFEELGDILMRD